MLINRKQSLGMQEFSQLMQYLLTGNSIDIIAVGFNYDPLKVSEYFTDHVQAVNHVYIKKTLMERFCTNITL